MPSLSLSCKLTCVLSCPDKQRSRTAIFISSWIVTDDAFLASSKASSSLSSCGCTAWFIWKPSHPIIADIKASLYSCLLASKSVGAVSKPHSHQHLAQTSKCAAPFLSKVQQVTRRVLLTSHVLLCLLLTDPKGYWGCLPGNSLSIGLTYCTNCQLQSLKFLSSWLLWSKFPGFVKSFLQSVTLAALLMQTWQPLPSAPTKHWEFQCQWW